eukprot:12623979-Prorocentrum_lima.AAC.1
MGMARKVVDQASQNANEKTCRPALNSTELSALEWEDFKAMICHTHPEDGKEGEIYIFKNYNHKKGKPNDMG